MDSRSCQSDENGGKSKGGHGMKVVNLGRQLNLRIEDLRGEVMVAGTIGT